MSQDILTLELRASDFEKICAMLKSLCGIKLYAGKEHLVKARLMKRLKALNFNNFSEYLKYLENDDSGSELALMVDLLTTNKTNFFREIQHFDYLRDEVLPVWSPSRLRIWSAGCSTGEEPYSLAILLLEELEDIKGRDIRILATDISGRVLEKAKRGEYEYECVKNMPKNLIDQYFQCVDTTGQQVYRVNKNVSNFITLARLNLMNSWPMRGPFDIIFCRNVMIYFEKETRERLVQRFWDMLKPGGYLFVGHSESLAALSHTFKYRKPAVYMKQELVTEQAI